MALTISRPQSPRSITSTQQKFLSPTSIRSETVPCDSGMDRKLNYPGMILETDVAVLFSDVDKLENLNELRQRLKEGEFWMKYYQGLAYEAEERADHMEQLYCNVNEDNDSLQRHIEDLDITHRKVIDDLERLTTAHTALKTERDQLIGQNFYLEQTLENEPSYMRLTSAIDAKESYAALEQGNAALIKNIAVLEAALSYNKVKLAQLSEEKAELDKVNRYYLKHIEVCAPHLIVDFTDVSRLVDLQPAEVPRSPTSTQRDASSSQRDASSTQRDASSSHRHSDAARRSSQKPKQVTNPRGANKTRFDKIRDFIVGTQRTPPSATTRTHTRHRPSGSPSSLKPIITHNNNSNSDSISRPSGSKHATLGIDLSEVSDSTTPVSNMSESLDTYIDDKTKVRSDITKVATHSRAVEFGLLDDYSETQNDIFTSDNGSKHSTIVHRQVQHQIRGHGGSNDNSFYNIGGVTDLQTAIGEFDNDMPDELYHTCRMCSMVSDDSSNGVCSDFSGETYPIEFSSNKQMFGSMADCNIANTHRLIGPKTGSNSSEYCSYNGDQQSFIYEEHKRRESVLGSQVPKVSNQPTPKRHIRLVRKPPSHKSTWWSNMMQAGFGPPVPSPMSKSTVPANIVSTIK